MDKQATKVFCGGLSWETTSERLRAYFENFGVVREAFVSYNRNNGRPRGFGFVVFESMDVADKVVSTKHTIDRREVECKRAVPKEEHQGGDSSNTSPPSSTGEGRSAASAANTRTRKIFVGGLAPAVDDAALLQHFEQFGPVEDAVVMYDHDNKRPRGFGFVTFANEDSVDKVFGRGAMQSIADKQIEIKPAVPRDQMPMGGAGRVPFFEQGVARGGFGGGRGLGQMGGYGGGGYGMGYRGYGPRGSFNSMGPMGGRGGRSGAGGGFGGGFSGMGGMQRGGYGGMSKMPPMGYDLYGAGGMFGSNAQALYNLTAGMQFNGMQPPAGMGASKLNAFNANNINLKALALASSLGGFQGSQPGEASFSQDDSRPYSGHGAAAAAAADYAAEAAAAANLTAATAPNGLSVTQDFNAYDTGFSTSPAPGWSS